jgi:hypothetical protein
MALEARRKMLVLVGVSSVGKSFQVERCTHRTGLSCDAGMPVTTLSRAYPLPGSPGLWLVDTPGTNTDWYTFPYELVKDADVCVVLIVGSRHTYERDRFLVRHPRVRPEQLVVYRKHTVPQQLDQPNQPPSVNLFRINRIPDAAYLQLAPAPHANPAHQPAPQPSASLAARLAAGRRGPRPAPGPVRNQAASMRFKLSRVFPRAEFPMFYILQKYINGCCQRSDVDVSLEIWLRVGPDDRNQIEQFSDMGGALLTVFLLDQQNFRTLLSDNHLRQVLLRITRGAIVPHLRSIYGDSFDIAHYGHYAKFLFFCFITESNLNRYFPRAPMPSPVPVCKEIPFYLWAR